jgi:phage/plasmid-like protein (TIGR03299 family)
MSRETMEWLNENTLIGLGHLAWHRMPGYDNHFDGPVPIDRVRALLPEVHSSPLYVNTPLGMMPVDGRQAIIRSDNGAVLGVFTDGYEIHQYGDKLVDTVATILDDSLVIGSAGLLKGGAQAWVSVEVPDTITTPEGVTFRPNLLACTSHDGSLATTFKRVVTVVVCDNTLAAGLGEVGQQLKIKHSKYSNLRIAGAREALAIVHTIADDFAAEVAALCAIDVSDKEWSAFLGAHESTTFTTDKGEDKTGRSLTLAENTRDALTQLWNTDVRVSPWRGTAFGVLQAVNTHVHHGATVRGATRPERNMSRAVTGGVDTLDTSTIATLTRVLANVA